MNQSATHMMDINMTSTERKPELIRALEDYDNLLERLAFNINHLDDRLSAYCSPCPEKDTVSAPPNYSSKAAARLSNNNKTLCYQLRLLEDILSTLEI